MFCPATHQGKGKVLKQGAEAVIYLSKYLGRTCVVKERIPKKYRDRKLDGILRRERTVHEGRMISLAKRAGVKTPIIYDIDIASSKITMQYLPGRTVREIFEKEVPSEIPRQIGRIAGSLHDGGLVHGDLTTSNMIDSSGLFIIDFGLSRKSAEIEDMGVDLLLMEEALIGMHPEHGYVLDGIRDGYASRFDRASEVFRRVSEIKGRRRYV